MKGYRRSGLGYVEVDIVYNRDGIPVIGEDTTTNPPPPEKFGFSLTIRNSKWVYEELALYATTDVESARERKLIEFERWKQDYVNSPTIYQDSIFHNDDEARIRVMGAVFAYREFKKLPPAWVAMGDKIISPLDIEFLLGLADALNTGFQKNFYVASTLEQQIKSAKTAREIQGIVFPDIPNYSRLLSELRSQNETGVHTGTNVVKTIVPEFSLMPKKATDTNNALPDKPFFRKATEKVLTISPGKPGDAEVYDKGLKLIANNVSEDSIIVIDTLNLDEHFKDYEIYEYVFYVSRRSSVVKPREVVELRKHNGPIKIELSVGESLWFGIVGGKKPTSGYIEGEIQYLTDLTMVSALLRVVTYGRKLTPEEIEEITGKKPVEVTPLPEVTEDDESTQEPEEEIEDVIEEPTPEEETTTEEPESETEEEVTEPEEESHEDELEETLPEEEDSLEILPPTPPEEPIVEEEEESEELFDDQDFKGLVN